MHTLEDIQELIDHQDFTHAETYLNTFQEKNAQWHYLYSLIALDKSWFDSALTHLDKAIALSPDEVLYQNAKTTLLYRHNGYDNDYYRRPRRRGSDCCCCCGDCCCQFDCCDLICLDSCCECMGGDLISCI